MRVLSLDDISKTLNENKQRTMKAKEAYDRIYLETADLKNDRKPRDPDEQRVLDRFLLK